LRQQRGATGAGAVASVARRTAWLGFARCQAASAQCLIWW